MSENRSPIPSRLYNAAKGGHVAGTADIIDDDKGKTQDVINQETDNALENRYTKEETYSKTELNNLITTPEQEYVSVVATDQTTAATDVLPVTGAADTTYRVGNWDGTQYNDSVFSEYAWNGSAYVKLSTKSQVGEVYDISANHAGATYADLAAALGTNGANIPQLLRKGGMSVKFVLSSNSKYVQYFLTKNEWSTNEADWEKMNLKEEVSQLDKEIDNYYGRVYGNTIVRLDEVAVGQILFDKNDVIIGETIFYSFKMGGTAVAIDLKDSSDNRIAYYGKDSGGTVEEIVTGSFTIPSNFDHAQLTYWSPATELVLNIADDKVVNKRLSALEGDNLRAGSDIFSIDNSYINATEGKVYRQNGFKATPLIYICKISNIVIKNISSSGALGYAFYDNNGVYISGSGATGVTSATILATNIPNNTVYVRFCSVSSFITSATEINIGNIESLGISIAQLKGQIEEENVKIGNINHTLSHFEKDYYDTNVTLQNGILNRWLEYVEGTAYRHAVLPVQEGDKFKISGKSYGSDYPLYILTLNSTVVSYDYRNYGTYHGIEITIPAGVNTLYVNGDNEGEGLVKVLKYEVGTKKTTSALIVGTDDDFLYNNVNSAVVDAGENGIVKVDFGTYETEVQGMGTNKRIIGADRDLCVLYNNSGEYDTPPIEIAGGVIKSMSVNVDASEATPSNAGYCVHSDHNNCDNNTLIIEDCNFNIKNANHAIGVGLRNGERLVFRNCTFIQRSDNNGETCVYSHNGGGSTVTPAKISFIGCKFIAKGKCIKLQSWVQNCAAEYEFIDNTFVSDIYGVSNDCIFIDNREGSTPSSDWSSLMYLADTCHGNNIELLNA